ncbi:hypothetical protein [Streptomyces sp. NBC_01092]|uniref:hypothetical protein n=1 Tax=Streptomyces sp. NBC_01092 TaxID=2903748 RepID=UPI00386AD520|nr:hypothetical protein OG254_37440 [Streptomyces sp. NBC_01092]
MYGKSRSLHGVVRSVRRFFRIPRGEPRHPSRVLPSLRICVFCLAVGALAAWAGWDEGPVVMTVAAVWSMLDDVIDGVRHRWPAFAAGLAVGWSVNRLMHASLNAPDSPWGEYPVYASTTLAALATFVAITHLPRRTR